MGLFYKPEAFLDLLAGGALHSPIARCGLVKPVEGDQSCLFFTEDIACPSWAKIPLEVIESVEHLSNVCSHPYVRLYFRAPKGNIAAAVFAGLLATQSSGSVRIPYGQEATTLRATKRIKITFDAKGDGTLECVGFSTFACQGRPGVDYRRDITVQLTDKEPLHHSTEYGVDMPWAIRIYPERGIFIHEWPYCSSASGSSAGCIHLCPPNAKTVYDWVDGPTRITTDCPW